MTSRLTILILSLILLQVLTACGEPNERIAPGDDIRYRTGKVVGPVVEPYPTKTTNYDASLFASTRSMKISQLVDIINNQASSYGYTFSAAMKAQARKNYPACGIFDNDFYEDSNLPATIVGVVTYHPRFYKKVKFCGTEARNYGSFWLQDETGGIFVERDGRLADFNVGDIVSLRVSGVHSNYDVPSIILFDRLTNLHKPKEKIYTQPLVIGEPAYHEAIDPGSKNSKIGQVVTVVGKLVDPPTNYNFNSACLVKDGGSNAPCEGACLSDKKCKADEKLYVAIDKEIGQRNPIPMKKGDTLKVIGPLSVGYNGAEVAVIQTGQYCVASGNQNDCTPIE